MRYLTILSSAGRKDGFLTVILQGQSVLLLRASIRTKETVLGREGVNHDNSPRFDTNTCLNHAANHRTLRLIVTSCRGKHSLEQLEHSRKAHMLEHMKLEHSRLVHMQQEHSSWLRLEHSSLALRHSFRSLNRD